MDYPDYSFVFYRPAEEAVVRADKTIVLCLYENRPAPGAYSWVYNGKMDCASGEVPVRLGEDERPFRYRTRADHMRYINKVRLRVYGKDSALERTVVRVFKTEVSRDGDDLFHIMRWVSL